MQEAGFRMQDAGFLLLCALQIPTWSEQVKKNETLVLQIKKFSSCREHLGRQVSTVNMTMTVLKKTSHIRDEIKCPDSLKFT